MQYQQIHHDSEDVPGLVDRLANMEDALPRWQGSMESITHAITSIGEIMVEGKADLDRADAQRKGFTGRRIVARRVAGRLKEPVDVFWSSSNEFASQLHQLDDGLRALVDHVGTEVRENPDAKPAVCEFFGTIRRLSASAHEALEWFRQMIQSAEPLASMSRDLRPTMRRLREGLTIMVEAQEVTDEWVHLTERVGLDCPEESRLEA